MTEQVTPPESSEGSPAQVAHGNPLGQVIARMSLTQLTLVVLTLVFLWQWFDAHQQIDQMQQQLAQRLSEMDGSSKASQALLAQNQEMVRELGGKLSVLESKYAEAQNQRAALETLYQEMSSSRDQTALAEVEQTLMIAEQQLQLAANVKAALIAMQHADSRLQRLDRPALAGLRKTIDHDIDKLKALPNIDVAGINVRLDGLVSAVGNLPLIQDIHPQESANLPEPAAEETAWQRFWHELWQDIRHLVRIENTEKQYLPLLSPTQSFFLRENLKIRLLSARLALLSRDEASFRHDVETAREWIQAYYDSRSKDTVQALAVLQKLANANISIELPDISDSLEAVRNYRIAHEKGSR